MPGADWRSRLTPNIYRYVVATDCGTAPNPFGTWCTLAICKPVIRRHAKVGDWIVGFRSKANDQVIYAMRVERVLTFAEYWQDRRFHYKRPDRTAFPDNIYRPRLDGELIWVDNLIHGRDATRKDTGGRHVLASKRFWYFGRESPSLPTELIHLVHSGQSHSVHKARKPDDADRLQAWLNVWPMGMHGWPIDAALPTNPSPRSRRRACAPAHERIRKQPRKKRSHC